MPQNIAIIGSGTMGRGIAIAAAQSGRMVRLYDIEENILTAAIQKIDATLQKGVDKGKVTPETKHAVLERIVPVSSMDTFSEVDIAIEAVPEKMELKRKVFAMLAVHCREDAILATNTSSLPVTAIAAQVLHPARVAGMHFFNPANIMKLVEVVRTRFTSEQTIQVLCDFVVDMGKTPARVQDTPGFIVNRVARSFYSESLRILEERVAAIEDIDRIVTGHGFRMGPFALMDLIGNDVNFEVTRSLFESYHTEARFRPSHIQKSLVDAGLLGRKTGRGFYEYSA